MRKLWSTHILRRLGEANPTNQLAKCRHWSISSVDPARVMVSVGIGSLPENRTRCCGPYSVTGTLSGKLRAADVELLATHRTHSAGTLLRDGEPNGNSACEIRFVLALQEDHPLSSEPPTIKP